MAAIVHVKPKSAWKSVKFSSFADSKGDFDGLISFEELTDYELHGHNSTACKTDKEKGKKPVKVSKRKGGIVRKRQLVDLNALESEENPSLKKKKKKMMPHPTDDDEDLTKQVKKKKPKKKKKRTEAKQDEDLDKQEEKTEVTEAKSGETGEKEQTNNKEGVTQLKKKKRKRKDKSKQDDSTSPTKKIKTTENTSAIVSSNKKNKRKNKDKYGSKSPSKKNTMKKSPVNKMTAEMNKTPINKSLTVMDAWKDLHVPAEVLWALRDQGFKEPTPIQRQVLPSAIRDQMDIVGAAETGSGKTLAFGIPILHFIMKEFQREHEKATSNTDSDIDSGIETTESTSLPADVEANAETDVVSDTDNGFTEAVLGTEADSDDIDNTDDEEMASMADNNDDNGSDNGSEESSGDDDMGDKKLEDLIHEDMQQGHDGSSSEEEELQDLQEDGLGCVSVIKDVDFSWMEEETGLKTDRRLKRTFPRALILEPTRELAVQVKNHLQAAAKYTNVKIAAIVGGLSLQKQRRILNKCPDLIVATPGRLWELIQEGEEFLSEVENIKHLVVDEADRMIEKGHFEELAKLLERIKRNKDNVNRHTYVFSATLTLVHSGPQRAMKKKKKIFDEKQKLVYLMRKMGLKAKPKVVDITRKIGMVDTLTEARINCDKLEKDIYLYYFLKQYPGRTLVFSNSKDCIRRLVSVLTLLQCSPLPLHADMHQRQRLKNLDKFTDNSQGLLIASDVAARGLDIPNVQHVIHYQVPHTVENYVHRSGRTARAYKEGLSVMIIGPDDVKNYRKIINTLNKSEDLPLFPTNQEYLPELRRRVNMVRSIETQEYRFKKRNRNNDWFTKAAEEAGIDIEDEGLLDDLGDDAEQMRQKKFIKHTKHELSILLKQPVLTRSTLSKYPTQSGKLVNLPTKETAVDALNMVKKSVVKAEEGAVTESTKESTQMSRSQKRRKLRREKWKQKQEKNDATTE